MLVLMLTLGCGSETKTLDAMPDFLLPDVNATSERAGEEVSPRDYLDAASVWYFGHAT
jgi:hypothetical protein